MSKIQSGPARGNQRAFEAGWDKAFGGQRCSSCDAKLTRLEVGLCASCRKTTD